MSKLSMRCPVCEEKTFFPGVTVFDDRYGEPNRYQLARCCTCKHIATAPRLHESDLPALYGTYYPRANINFNDVICEAAKVNRAFARFIRWWNGTDNQGQYNVRPGEVMLDVGCGSGVSLLEARALGAIAFGVEADPNVKPIAEALDLSIHFGNLQDVPFPETAFDLIVMNQVIEHFPDPDLALCNLRDRLTPNGRMILVFPNTASFWRRLSGDRWINWHVPYHLHHFTFDSFRRMAQNSGFRVVRSRTITPNVWTFLQLRASCCRTQNGLPSPIWTNTARSATMPMKSRSFNLLRRLFRISALAACAAVNRAVDALGMGDSLLVELRRSE